MSRHEPHPLPPPDFTGRESALAWLRERVDAYPVLLVLGLPGCGKTSLLAALARELGRDRPIRWLDGPGNGAATLNEGLAAARQQGAILFADDLHLAGLDGPAPKLVRAAVASSKTTALVAASRRAIPLGPVEALSVCELVVSELAPEPGAALLRELAGDAAARVESLYPLTGGNPLAIRLLARLGRDGVAPDGLRAALVRFTGEAGLNDQTDGLEERDLRCLEAMSVMEGPADGRFLEESAGLPSRELERRFLAIPEPPGRWRMSGVVRTWVLSQMGRDRRERWELEAGRQLEARGALEEAHGHLCEAGAGEDAARVLSELAQPLGRAGRHARLLEMAERTARLASSLRVELVRVRALASLGRLHEAQALLRERRQQAAARADKAAEAELLVCQADLHRQAGDLHRSLRASYDALQKAEESGAGTAQVAALERLSVLHAELGEPDRALALLERARGLAEGPLPGPRGLEALATLEEQAGRLESAERYYREALEVSSDTEDRASLELRLAVLKLEGGRREDAAAHAKRACSLARDCDAPRVQARALCVLARVARSSGRLTEARRTLDEAIGLLPRQGGGADRVTALLERGEIALMLGDHRASARDVDQALAIASGEGDPSLTVRAFTILGSLAADRGEYGRAAECYRQAMERVRQGAGTELLAEVLTGMAAVSRGRGEYRAAAQLLEQAHRAIPKRGRPRPPAQPGRWLSGTFAAAGSTRGNAPPPGTPLEPATSGTYPAAGVAPAGLSAAARALQARVLLEKASLARARGDPRAALEHAAEAGELAREAGDRPLAGRISIETAGVFRDNGEYAKAIETLTTVLEQGREMGDRYGQALCLHELARCYQERGEYSKAERLHRRGAMIAQKLGAQHLTARFLNARAHIECDRGRSREGLELYRQARQLLRRLQDKKESQRTLGGMAEIHARRREFPRARRLIEECLRLASALPDPAGTARALSQLSGLELMTGNPLAALHQQRKSLAMKEELGDVRGMVESLIRIARIHAALGEPEKAVPVVRRGTKLARELGLARSESLLLLEEAGAALTTGDLAEAERLAGEALGLAAGLDFAEGLARGYRLLGLVHKRALRYDLSQRHLNRALRYFKKLDRDQETEELLAEIRSVSRDNIERLLGLRDEMLADAGRLEQEILSRWGRHRVLLLAELVAEGGPGGNGGVDATMERMEQEDELLVPRILSHGGSIALQAGGRLVASFENAEDALDAAREILSELASREGGGTGPEPRSGSEAPPLRSWVGRPELRIGLHEAIVAGAEGHLAGDAVRLLGRVLALARPEEILLTEPVRRALLEPGVLPLEALPPQRTRSDEPDLLVYRVGNGARHAGAWGGAS